ncbi:MAG: GNAT family N-acetyltransferase [Patescibacteria group bacterium]
MKGDPEPMITGKKVLLREFRAEDLPAIQAWVNNPRIRKHLAFSVYPQTLEGSRAYLERQLQGQEGNVTFVIALRDDPEQKYIGSVGLHNIDRLHRHAEIGITLAREDLFGKGLGGEATYLICAFAFLRLGLHKVNLRCFAYNERGLACYRRAGFREAGRLREDHFYNGAFHDDVLMDLLASEFLAAHPEAFGLFE